MAEWVIGIWAFVVAIVGLNLCAAGMAAILHAWRSQMRRGGRAVLASALSAILPSSFLVVVPLTEGWGEWESGWILAIAMALALGTVVSLPGSLFVARKLEAPGDDFRAFE
jgi:hypothetical protein